MLSNNYGSLLDIGTEFDIALGSGDVYFPEHYGLCFRASRPDKKLSGRCGCRLIDAYVPCILRCKNGTGFETQPNVPYRESVGFLHFQCLIGRDENVR